LKKDNHQGKETQLGEKKKNQRGWGERKSKARDSADEKKHTWTPRDGKQ